MVLFHIVHHILSVSEHLNISIEGFPSPSKDQGPRPFCERSLFFSMGVHRKVDIGDDCNASKENEDKDSDGDPN